MDKQPNTGRNMDPSPTPTPIWIDDTPHPPAPWLRVAADGTPELRISAYPQARWVPAIKVLGLYGLHREPGNDEALPALVTTHLPSGCLVRVDRYLTRTLKSLALWDSYAGRLGEDWPLYAINDPLPVMPAWFLALPQRIDRECAP